MAPTAAMAVAALLRFAQRGERGRHVVGRLGERRGDGAAGVADEGGEALAQRVGHAVAFGRAQGALRQSPPGWAPASG